MEAFHISEFIARVETEAVSCHCSWRRTDKVGYRYNQKPAGVNPAEYCLQAFTILSRLKKISFKNGVKK